MRPIDWVFYGLLSLIAAGAFLGVLRVLLYMAEDFIDWLLWKFGR